MAHSVPTRVSNHGEGKRLAIGVSAFVVELTVDRRVRVVYDTWRAARAPIDREFELLLAEHPETMDLFITEVFARDHAALAPVVRQWLHKLPARWTAMITGELLRAFRLAHYHGRTRADRPPLQRPTTAPQYGVAVQLQPAHQRGKVPHDPFPVARNMRTLYRHYVQEPPDSLRTLAREHASWANRANPEDCERDVKRYLRQARALLDLAAASVWAESGRILVPGP